MIRASGCWRSRSQPARVQSRDRRGSVRSRGDLEQPGGHGDRRHRRRRRRAERHAGDAEAGRRRRHRRDALDPRPVFRPPARGDGGGRPAAVLSRTRDGGIVVRVPPATPSGSQPGGRQQRGGAGRAPNRGQALRGRAGARRRPDRVGRARAEDRSPPARRPRAARAGSRCRRTAGPPTWRMRRDRS